MKVIIDHTLRLTVICAIASSLLAYVYKTTLPRINENREKDKVIKIKSVLPADVDEIKEVAVGKKIFYEGYSAGELQGTVIECSENGYGGLIKILVGVDKNGKIIDYNVLSHKETPGLGTKIVEPLFRDQFKNQDIRGVILKQDEPKVKGDAVTAATSEGLGIDAITAATISSRAVVKAVRKALKDFEEVRNGR